MFTMYANWSDIHEMWKADIRDEDDKRAAFLGTYTEVGLLDIAYEYGIAREDILGGYRDYA